MALKFCAMFGGAAAGPPWAWLGCSDMAGVLGRVRAGGRAGRVVESISGGRTCRERKPAWRGACWVPGAGVDVDEARSNVKSPVTRDPSCA